VSRGHEPRITGAGIESTFVAEFGDKAMLAAATFAARGQPVLVWIGATVGIFLAGALGLLAGRALGVRLRERTVRVGSAVLFAGFGVGLIIAAF
jgi:putative Ca2+/H+ antiporter (TMEM165/GDT1 family)